MPLQPPDEAITLLKRLALRHNDLMFLTLRPWPGRSWCLPTKQPTDQASHSGTTQRSVRLQVTGSKGPQLEAAYFVKPS